MAKGCLGPGIRVMSPEHYSHPETWMGEGADHSSRFRLRDLPEEWMAVMTALACAGPVAARGSMVGKVGHPDNVWALSRALSAQLSAPAHTLSADPSITAALMAA